MSKNLFRVLIFSIFISLLISCSKSSTLIETKVKNIEKIIIKHDEREIEFTDTEDIELLVCYFDRTYVKEKNKDIWGNLGKTYREVISYAYEITIYTKDTLFSKAKEYSFYVDETIKYYKRSTNKLDKTEHFRNNCFKEVGRKQKYGTVKENATDYLEKLFLDNDEE